MFRNVKEYFTFNRSQRRGIFVLLLILLLIIAVNLLMPLFVSEDKVDFNEFAEKIREFEEEQKMLHDDQKKDFDYSSVNESVAKSKITPFLFNPNNLPESKWKELGLNEWQIGVIKNYEAKGGRFYKKEDLAKMYSISEAEYQILEPFIVVEKKNTESPVAKETHKLSPFPFDPNTIPADQLLKMGLDDKIVKTIEKYRNKGGRFLSKEDLKKIYGLSDSVYFMLESYIVIQLDTINERKQIAEDKPLIIELNSADSLDLQQLRGVGTSYAKRIIKYRNILGGYARKEQLLEVYGMDSVRYYGIVPAIRINDSLVNKIQVNTATIKDLTKHPYIDFYVAKSIVKYRNEKGKIVKIEELLEADLVYNELFDKISPYLYTGVEQ